MKILYFICTFLTLVLLDVAFCESDLFLDKIPPVIIIKKTQNEKSLFSYSMAGKSASGYGSNQQSKLLIGGPSNKTGTTEKLLECTLSLKSNRETGSTNNNVDCADSAEGSSSACKFGIGICKDLHNYYTLRGFSAHFDMYGLSGMPGFGYEDKGYVRKGQYYDYFGYSITSGVYFWKDVKQYAIGSPRGSTGKGNVFIMRLDKPSSTDVDAELQGDKFGSYFGSVLASVDLNSDGFDELLVAAPTYTTTSYDEGCVFVYYRNLGTPSFQTSGPGERWCPSDTPGGRFGSSIAPLGDINEDGFGDVAISTPYADNGRVYIYFGGGARTLREYVVIEPSPKTNINGFGTSVVGNVDLDGNGTPDLAVGSFLSKSIAVFLTRARVVLSVSFGADSGYPQPSKFKREDSSFILRPLICAQLKSASEMKSLPSRLAVWVKVVADSQVSPKRFLIDRPVGIVGNERLRSVEIPMILQERRSGGLLCGNQHIFVTAVPKNLKPEDQRKIAFEWQVWYNETSTAVYNTDVIDVNNPQASRKSKRGSFCSDCPAPKGPDLFNYDVQLEDNCNDDGNPECSPELAVTVQFRDNEGKELDEVTIGSTPLVNVKIDLKNKKETAYYPRVTVRLTSDIIDLTGILTLNAPKCSSKHFNNDSSIIVLSCQDIVMHKNSPEETFTGTLHFKYLRAKAKPAKILMRVDANPEGMPETSWSQEKTLVVKTDVNLKIMAIESKKAPLSDREITEFVHQFRVQNAKPSPPEKVELSFKFPQYYGNEKQPVVTLTSADSPTVSIQCADHFQMLLQSTPSRNVKESTSSEVTRLVSLGCGNKNQKCVQVNCTGSFPDNNHNEFDIRLHYRFNSTLARKLKIINNDLMELAIMTSALLQPFDEMNGKPTSVTATQIFTITAVFVGPTAIQLIFAGVIGLILLLAIVVGLFKCGFFRRKTKERLDALKEEEENLTTNSSINHYYGTEPLEEK